MSNNDQTILVSYPSYERWLKEYRLLEAVEVAARAVRACSTQARRKRLTAILSKLDAFRDGRGK